MGRGGPATGSGRWEPGKSGEKKGKSEGETCGGEPWACTIWRGSRNNSCVRHVKQRVETVAGMPAHPVQSWQYEAAPAQPQTRRPCTGPTYRVTLCGLPMNYSRARCHSSGVLTAHSNGGFRTTQLGGRLPRGQQWGRALGPPPHHRHPLRRPCHRPPCPRAECSAVAAASAKPPR